MTILPDYLRPGLDVVFCGTAAGAHSARRACFYAGPGNRFWPMLYRTGLTPELLRPEDCGRVLEFGIGLTDLVKHHSGSDASLTREMYDPEDFDRKIRTYRPRVVAFNGRKAAATFLRARSVTLQYGLHSKTIEKTRIFILPSTSRAANGSWTEQPWCDLAEFLG